MKTLKVSLLIISLVTSLLSCTENDAEGPGPIPSDSTDVPLTDDQVAFLETLRETTIPLEDIYLDDGQKMLTFLQENDPGFLQGYPYGRAAKTKALTPFQQKHLFFSKMYVMGYYLADDSEHTHLSAGADSPAQTGLAYSWGSKDYAIRQVPPVASGCMNLKIYGLDCTGMLWAMTQAANLTVVPKYNFFVQYISTAKKWTDAFKASADYKDLEMKDMGQLPPDKINNGDIILWGSHVGVFLYGSFYQSNGSANAPSCNNNLLTGRGPRMISLAEVLSYGLGPYKVFRTVHKHNYTLKIEHKANEPCGYDGQDYYDAVEMDVTVEDDIVSVSNIVNYEPTIFPLTISVLNCSLTCIPGSTGELNVTSGSGKVDPPLGLYDELRFHLDLVNWGAGVGTVITLACPDADPITQAGDPYDYSSHWQFDLIDSIQIQNPPGSYGIFVKLTPK
jgi:hypothetical protein